MKHIIFPCLFLCLIFSQAFAQEDIIQNHSGLQFYFVNGYAVSYKLPTTGIWKYRINLDFSANYGYQTEENTQASYLRSESDNNRSISITLTPQAYINILTTEYANVYTGGGIFVGYNYSKQTSSSGYHNIMDTANYINVYKEISYTFGLSALLGIEVAVTKNVTAFAESQLYGGKSWSSYKVDNIQSENVPSWQNSSGHGWFVNYSTIRMGISIYF
ncbi:MAG: hypothetical protein Q8903_08175 [Bacteroidota bacterium]|nr:hypothetical protein [Bacteroidota bacterium]